MRRIPFILIGIVAIAIAMFAFTACDDEPTQAEANERFCDSVGDLSAALRNLRDLDSDTTVEEYQDERDQVTESYEAMIEAAASVVGLRLEDLEESRDDLQDALDDVPEDATLGEALEAVDDEVDNVARELSQVLNDVDCSGLPGEDTQSDE